MSAGRYPAMKSPYGGVAPLWVSCGSPVDLLWVPWGQVPVLDFELHSQSGAWERWSWSVFERRKAAHIFA